ncbi:hypothetical protein [Roseomonas sp. CECT 9278]|uniref:hypothetical protein n=1 Tax=Roseomonas sp. CECT 9278 TaxID=2845823 RepID=UPI001E5E016D|nr:hypothetical protein [Roseomonas sp. CECT 9278]CAH0166345.1 hypothetical protein ROS9278_01087 [Roseomonas sp. CECT 9278]
MSFSIVAALSGDLGPGGVDPFNPPMTAHAVERIALPVPAGDTRSVTMLAKADPTMRLLAIGAGTAPGLTFGLNGAAPSTPLTAPFFCSGAMLAGAMGQDITSLTVTNAGEGEALVHVLLFRDA